MTRQFAFVPSEFAATFPHLYLQDEDEDDTEAPVHSTYTVRLLHKLTLKTMTATTRTCSIGTENYGVKKKWRLQCQSSC